MKKRVFSLFLALVMAVSLVPAALAAEAVEPTPPEWIKAEEYLIIPNDAVYAPVNWTEVETLREDACQGGLLPKEGKDWAEGSAGACYETGLVRLKYAENAGVETQEGRMAFYSAGRAFSAAQSQWYSRWKEHDTLYYRLGIEKYRAWLVYSYSYVGDWGRSLSPALEALDMSIEDFFSGQYMYLVSDEVKAKVVADVASYQSQKPNQAGSITLWLDGSQLHMDIAPEVRNERTMVPIRAVAEALGADVKWMQDTQQIVMTRAGVTVTMTLNSTIATIDDKTIEMDVAPYANNGRTLIPVRYMAEFFGQKVDWDGRMRQVLITEDKSMTEGSNLEAWALAMGALLNYSNNRLEAHLFGGKARFGMNSVGNFTSGRLTSTGPDFGRYILSDSWLITNRTSLLATTEALTAGNDAWDWCRVSLLAQWGYLAGYVTYPEALELVEPAAKKVCATYSSWEKVYEVYITGYCRWLGKDTTDVWSTDRGQLYQAMLSNPHMARILDDTLFSTGVIGLPEAE